MKVYAIYNDDLEKKIPIGYLFYYEKPKEFVIELREDVSEWDVPILFQNYVKQNKYMILKEISSNWVNERIIPSSRQNIGVILRNSNLKNYNEIDFLKSTKGRCSQDNCYFEEINVNDISKDVAERRKKNINSCFFSNDKSLICLFKNNNVKRISLNVLKKYSKVVKNILNNVDFKNSVEIDIDGYGVVFDENTSIESSFLYENGELLNTKANDFLNFAKANIISTSQTCNILKCSRQNIDYLVKSKQLTPIFSSTKENMFLKSDILSIANQ